jgi:hypothetical protein
VVFRQVDFIALPTLKKKPPMAPLFGDALFEDRVFKIQSTVAVNYAENPAIAIPGIELACKIGGEPPFLLSLSLLNVRGYRICNDPIFGSGRPFDRDHLNAPAQVLQSISSDALKAAVKALIDSVWNAGGMEGSPNFDAEGNWTKR